jgi:predicted peptidase
LRPGAQAGSFSWIAKTAQHANPIPGNEMHIPTTCRLVPLALCINAVACTSSIDAAEDPLQVEWARVSYGQNQVNVAVLRPDGYSPTGNHPVVVALPWGSGTADLVLGLVATYWSEEAPARGYIVVAPEILGSSLETEAADFIPALFAWMDSNLSYDASRVVLTGASNGGRGIFFVAAVASDRFGAVIGMPGSYAGDGDALAGLNGKPAWLMVGEFDTGWLASSETTRSLLEAQGAIVTLDVLPGQGHVLSVPQSQLMDWIDDVWLR